MFQRANMPHVYYCHDVMEPEHHKAYVQLKERDTGTCPSSYFDPLWEILDRETRPLWLPESSVSPFYRALETRYGASRLCVVRKNSYAILQEQVLASATLQKGQKKALAQYFAEHDRLSMRYLKASQRKAIAPFLYQKPEGEMGLLVDDALFTGSTVASIRVHCPEVPAIHLFGARYPDDMMVENMLYWNHSKESNNDNGKELETMGNSRFD